MVSHSPTQPDNFDWLAELINQLNSLYMDSFVLKPEGYSVPLISTVKHEKHGECIQVTYSVLFDGDQSNPYAHRLPVEDGPFLMQLIEAVADSCNADPPLVATKTKGRRDFCDWAIMPDGHGEIRVFFRKGIT